MRTRKSRVAQHGMKDMDAVAIDIPIGESGFLAAAVSADCSSVALI